MEFFLEESKFMGSILNTIMHLCECSLNAEKSRIWDPFNRFIVHIWLGNFPKKLSVLLILALLLEPAAVALQNWNCPYFFRLYKIFYFFAIKFWFFGAPSLNFNVPNLKKKV